MAVVTGMLSYFDWKPVAPNQPTLRFHPRSRIGHGGKQGISARPERLLSHTPVDAVFDFVGWEVNLVPTIGLVPETWYELELIELDSAGRFTRSHWWPERIFVPVEGGDFMSLPSTPLSAEWVFVGLTPPPDGWSGYWIYSPGPGESMPLDDPNVGMLRRKSNG